jgi:Ca2+-binding RTX toxin-like protein
MRRAGTLAALAIATSLLTLAASAPAAVTCAYQQAGAPGPSGNELVVRGSAIEDQAAIRRDGAAIRVSDDRSGAPVSCSGPQATVRNLDLIRFLAVADGAGIFLVRAPTFAPGASVEATGRPEIEVSVESAGGVPGNVGVSGTRRRDAFALGDLPGTGGGVNYDFRESSDDVDLTFDAGVVGVLVRAGRGDDTVGAGGGDGFSGGLRAALTAYGGGGRDSLIGGRLGDVLAGRAGDDTLRGVRGGDDLSGGLGTDTLAGQFGGDTFAARDGTRDRVVCGPGRDGGRADRSDRLEGCERVVTR